VLRVVLLVTLATAGALITLTTALDPSPGPKPSRFLSPGGSDTGDCSEQAKACRSLDYAYRQASPGDIVELAAGRYGAQDLRRDPTKTSPDDVVFQPHPGAQVRLAALDFGHEYDDVGAAHVTVTHVTVDDWATFHRTEDVSLRHVRIRGAVFASGARDLTFFGGAWGDPAITNDGGHPEFVAYDRRPTVVRPRGLTIEGVLIHDVLRPDEATHSNCLHLEDGTDIVVRGNRFRRCDVLSMLVSPSGVTGPLERVVIENNVFEPSTNVGGAGSAYYSAMFTPTSAPVSGLVLRGNTFSQPWVINGGAMDKVEGTVSGNRGPNSGCAPRLRYADNRWSDGPLCGTGDQR
jgi:hypothetical protein